MKITRMSLAVMAAVAGLFVTAGPALADPPQAVLQEPTVDLPGTTAEGVEGYCAFPVHIEVVANPKTTTTENPDESTSTHFTGWGKATVTNVDTGKTLVYKISGPGTITSFPDESFTLDVTGQNLLYTSVENSFTGVPQLSYTTGHVKVAVDETGLTTDYSLSGKRTDVCAALA